MANHSTLRPTFAQLPDADLCLVSCVKEKMAAAAPARRLYASDYFRKMRSVVERAGWQWCVLSAKYGLLDPDEVVEPYDKTLNNMPRPDRVQWANRVLRTLEPRLEGVRSVVVFASNSYQEFVVPALQERGIAVHDPMKDMPIGKRLRWLKQLLES